MRVGVQRSGIFGPRLHRLRRGAGAVGAARRRGGDWPLMFLWLGVALIVDGIDGTLARAADVAKLLPRWSGDTLDLVVDFTTYVFVPAYAIAAGGLMPQAWAIPAAVVIAVTGTLYFADTHHEDRRQFLPRLSGGVEPGGVLSAAAEARARGAAAAVAAVRGADVCADPVSSIRSGCGGCAR